MYTSTDLEPTFFTDYMRQVVIPYEEPCLIQQFFEEEAKKPPSQRSSACMISCPCSRCSPQC